MGSAILRVIDGSPANPETGAPGESFGSALALKEGRLLVSAPYADPAAPNSGALYAYHLDLRPALSLEALPGGILVVNVQHALPGRTHLLESRSLDRSVWGVEQSTVPDQPHCEFTLPAPSESSTIYRVRVENGG